MYKPLGLPGSDPVTPARRCNDEMAECGMTSFAKPGAIMPVAGISRCLVALTCLIARYVRGWGTQNGELD